MRIFFAHAHGKTSLLRAVNLLGDIDFGRYSPSFIRKICIECFGEESVDGVAGSIGEGVIFDKDQRRRYLWLRQK